MDRNDRFPECVVSELFSKHVQDAFVSLGDTISEDAGMVLLRGLTDCSMTLSETIGCVASSGVHVLVVMCSKSSNIVQAHPLIPTMLVSSFFFFIAFS